MTNMIDYNKIGECLATMAKNSKEAVETGNFAINQLFGLYGSITEDTLHKGFEYAISKQKKEIEENPFLTSSQKEDKKQNIELFLKACEEWQKGILRSQGRLL